MRKRSPPSPAPAEGTGRPAPLDRSVVVEGAPGTGKTRSVVERLLLHLLAPAKGGEETTERGGLAVLAPSRIEAGHLRALGAKEIRRLPGGEEVRRTALGALRRVTFDSFPSFAARLLRGFPIEAGVDPALRLEEAAEGGSAFPGAWEAWLEGEMGKTPADPEGWVESLREVPLGWIERLARDLARSAPPGPEKPLNEDPLAGRFRGLAEEARSLAAPGRGAARGGKIVEGLLDASRALFEALAEGGRPSESLSGAQRDMLKNGLAGGKSAEGERGGELVRLAARLLEAEPRWLDRLRARLRGFFDLLDRRRGWPGFLDPQEAVARARRLVEDHPEVRGEIVRRFRALLVDDFQEADPPERDLIVRLGEGPGRLFAALDPNGSPCDGGGGQGGVRSTIDRLVGEGALHVRLTRSHRALPSLVEATRSVFSPREGGPLVADESARPEGTEGTPPWTVLRFEGEGGRDDGGSVVEAEGLARYLTREIVGRPRAGEGSEPYRWGEVALLFPRGTPIEPFLRVFRDRGYPCRVGPGGARGALQEERDLLVLLDLVDNLSDRLAFASVLRSPLGGLDDVDLFRLAAPGQGFEFDPRRPEEIPEDLNDRERLDRLCRALVDLHVLSRVRSVGETIDETFRRLPVLESAGRTGGEEAVAALLEIRRIAQAWGGDDSLRGFLRRRGRGRPLDGSAGPPLTDGEEALRLLPLREARGLEFPVVVVCGAGGGGEGASEPPAGAELLLDRSTGLSGIVLGASRDRGAVLIEEDRRAAAGADAERAFLFAASRARDRLILSTGPGEIGERGLLALLRRSLGSEPPRAGLVPVGSTQIRFESVPADAPPGRLRIPTFKGGTPGDLLPRWTDRARRGEAVRTEESRGAEPPPFSAPLLEVLREWDVGRGEAGLPEVLDRAEGLETSARETLLRFARSETFRSELEGARVAARRVPYTLLIDGRGVEGTVDAVVERRGKVCLVRWCLDPVDAADVPARAESLRAERAVLSEVARRFLGVEAPEIRFFFLVPALAVDPG